MVMLFGLLQEMRRRRTEVTVELRKVRYFCRFLVCLFVYSCNVTCRSFVFVDLHLFPCDFQLMY